MLINWIGMDWNRGSMDVGLDATMQQRVGLELDWMLDWMGYLAPLALSKALY